MAASIFQAVVDQTVAGLTQGRELDGQDRVPGRPAPLPGRSARAVRGDAASGCRTRHLPGGRRLLRRHRRGPVHRASATTRTASTKCWTFSDTASTVTATVDTMPPLFTSTSGVRGVLPRGTSAMTVPTVDLAHLHGRRLPGHRRRLHHHKARRSSTRRTAFCTRITTPTRATPSRIVLEQLKRDLRHCGDRSIRSAGAAVTGYGEELIKNAFGL